MSPSVPRSKIRLAIAAGAVALSIGCADGTVPTGPAPREQASLAAGNAGGSVVKSVVGLEPLLDASLNVSSALRVSDLGQVVGRSATSDDQLHAVIWDGGTLPQDLGVLAGGLRSVATAILPNGSLIVGYSDAADGDEHGVRWLKVNGAWTIDELPKPLGTTGCRTSDIAGDGTILGDCVSNGQALVTIWRNGVATALGPGVGVAINRYGQILVATADQRSVMWDLRTDPITITPLGTLGGSTTFALDINDAGEVVGQSSNAANQPRPFLWTSKRGMIDLGTLGGSFGVASAINSAGQIVGSAQNASQTFRATYWAKGKIVDLGALPPYEKAGAQAINNVGHVAGFSEITPSDSRATLWTLK